MKVFYNLALLVLGVSLCESYRILAIFPYSLRSHRGVLEPMAKALAKKGHQVDVISNYVQDKPFPNYKNIVELPTPKDPIVMDYATITNRELDDEWLNFVNSKMCDLLGHPEISKIIKSPPTDPPYDFLLVHTLTGYQCLEAIGYKWNIPVGSVVTTALYPQMHHMVGNPLNLAISPSHLRSFKENMSFWDRIYNVVMTNYEMYMYYKFAGMQDYYIKKYLGADMPSYHVLEKNLALMFSNSHYSYHGIKPKTPGVIEIGGINVNNNTAKLDLKLKKVLDESKDGFIYFSFGSLTSIESLPREVLENFYEALAKASPVRVIMKAPKPEAMPRNMPKNVFTFSWLPQQQILQHPNIKLFVTHGGALGTQEAIYYKVPMICVPFFAEQFMNCDILSNKKVAFKIDIRTADKDEYLHAFRELLTNPLYRDSMDKLSAMYRDRNLGPEESVTYWTEYVIRHGKNALRSPAVELSWWQIELFDVYAFLAVCAITILLFISLIGRMTYNSLLRMIHSIKTTAKSRKSKKLN